MKVAVLNYTTGSVDIFEIPEGERIEWYLTKKKGYRLEEIHWMEVWCININVGV